MCRTVDEEVRLGSDSTGRTRLSGPPVESAVRHQVDEGHEHRGGEDQDLDEAETAQALGVHGPGEEEDDLDVHHHKDHGDQVEAHGEAPCRLVGRDDAAFVGRLLGGGGPLRRQQLGRAKRKARECDPEHDHEEDGEVAVEAAHNVGSGSTTCAPLRPHRVGERPAARNMLA